MADPENILRHLYKDHFGKLPDSITPLPASGSDRKYFRIKSQDINMIGVFNEAVRENEAFIHFSKHFRRKELPVPDVFTANKEKTAYVQTDLGDDTLFSVLTERGLTDEVQDYYINTVKWLPSFQCEGIKGLDLSYCWPRKEFDRQSMMWDLNYFKYYYVKLTGIPFDEQALEDDFRTLLTFLEQAQADTFMYRDFQSRNIMLVHDDPYFIDYQGGRVGPLQYDVVSLLYDAKANLPQSFRNQLLAIYLETIKSHIPGFSMDEFLHYYPGFILMRILQALGAYGFRGFYQKKAHFLQSVPYALANLKALFAESNELPELPELKKLLQQEPSGTKISPPVHTGLNVHIVSFSFKQGIPTDHSGNGGGFIFDCRALPNPGRLEEYQSQSGLDDAVITYLKNYPEITGFLQNVYNIVDATVKNYLERGFHNLMVGFGCTGGRHRSVYCAEKLANHLNEKYGMNIIPEHSEKVNW
ncbi:MAG TPA: RNase adapter RapZ [Lentimicrobium sp.]|nr:RNase adapter RapZ [Lentimicrobium sp.]